MCGRYALSLPPSRVRQRLADQNMPADQAPEDDDDQTRQTYNFAPGYHGLIYRADTSDRGNAPGSSQGHDGEPSPKRTKLSHNGKGSTVDGSITKETHYKLQAMKWGLIPFWTKRPPDYGSQMRTINCRDDSLIENRGMWNTMKQRKRCIVVAEGFYEWLKKNGGKEKIPHFMKRKDGQLMCFAGLWDMVQYEGSEEKLYTYTIITTDSNKQLSFLHDRMPVILEPESEEMKAWLDPNRIGWDKELQGMLKPFQGELDCYPVDKGVGKVGNNSPQFVVPVDSKENKKNIANFFSKQKETANDVAAKNEAARKEKEVKQEGEVEMKKEENEDRATSKVEEPEANAPLPKPKDEADEDLEKAIQASLEDVDDELMNDAAEQSTETSIKREVEHVKDEEILEVADKKPVNSEKRAAAESPVKETPAKKTRSATSNQTVAKSPAKGGNAKITKFFGK